MRSLQAFYIDRMLPIGSRRIKIKEDADEINRSDGDNGSKWYFEDIGTGIGADGDSGRKSDLPVLFSTGRRFMGK